MKKTYDSKFKKAVQDWTRCTGLGSQENISFIRRFSIRIKDVRFTSADFMAKLQTDGIRIRIDGDDVWAMQRWSPSRGP